MRGPGRARVDGLPSPPALLVDWWRRAAEPAGIRGRGIWNVGHPWVTGEIALGDLAQRREVLRLLDGLPQAHLASVDELAGFIETHHLYGLGIGYVDVQLLAAARLSGAHLEP